MRTVWLIAGIYAAGLTLRVALEYVSYRLNRREFKAGR
jgi:hypothetical protein